ncbi:MAG: VirB3 family type IV secretion system protein [Rickettsiales bacterium]|jgi:type IV secretory pathway VirB3-like protein|nr:VirB3 family type IV secretion system protein [Rickettsiales bacterium]
MREPIYKAITNPIRILGVPYGIAMVNFFVFFLIFIGAFMAHFVVFGDGINPLWFVMPFIIMHYILANVSKSEPQLGKMIAAKMGMISMKIPKNLIG